MKKKIMTGMAAMVVVAMAMAVDYDRFLKASDGEVIGVLELGKQKVQLTGTIKEITWTATNGKSITLRWDGNTLKRD